MHGERSLRGPHFGCRETDVRFCSAEPHVRRRTKGGLEGHGFSKVSEGIRVAAKVPEGKRRLVVKGWCKRVRRSDNIAEADEEV